VSELEIVVTGELDLADSGRLATMLEEASAPPSDVVIDLADCEFIDASVLGIVASAGRGLAPSGRRIELRGADGQVRRLLATSGFEDGVRWGEDLTFGAVE
jgi:anti-anti-sigma factor